MAYVLEGRIPGPEGPQRARFAVEGEVFVEVDDDAEPDVVFHDGLLLPAALDIHVHFREPGGEHKETIVTGTRSAAHGGVALAVDMPNTDPPTTDPAAYTEKVERVEERALIDVGLWAGIGPGLDAFKLGDRATGYKLYAGPTTGDLLLPDPEAWERAIEAGATTERPIVVHAEDPAILQAARDAEEDFEDPASHARTRPKAAELAVFERLAPIAEEAGTHLHAAHVSDPRTADLCREYGLSSEVTPHHLLLDSEDVDRLGAYAKVNPPIRDAETRASLYEALADGRIDCVASDHAPHTREEKDAGFQRAPSGLPGVETLYPLMLAEALAGRIPLDRVLDACCVRPAEVLGVPAGRLEPGRWANLVHVPADPGPIEEDRLHSKCGWTPFEGREALFPDALMVRGEWVLREDGLVAEPGDGSFVGGPGWVS